MTSLVPEGGWPDSAFTSNPPKVVPIKPPAADAVPFNADSLGPAPAHVPMVEGVRAYTPTEVFTPGPTLPNRTSSVLSRYAEEAEAGAVSWYKRPFVAVGGYMKSAGSGIAKAWNGIGEFISDKWSNLSDRFFRRSSSSSSAGNKKILIGIVAAIGLVVGLSKLLRSGPAHSYDTDPEAEKIRAAERAAIANDIRAVQADTKSMYANQGNWTKGAPQPVANYQQTAIDQQSQKSETQIS